MCADAKRRDKVKKLFEEKGTNQSVRFLAPEEVVTAIDEFSPADISAETLVRGYRVKVNRKAVSSGELAGKRAVIAEVIAKSMMR